MHLLMVPCLKNNMSSCLTSHVPSHRTLHHWCWTVVRDAKTPIITDWQLEAGKGRRTVSGMAFPSHDNQDHTGRCKQDREFGGLAGVTAGILQTNLQTIRMVTCVGSAAEAWDGRGKVIASLDGRDCPQSEGRVKRFLMSKYVNTTSTTSGNTVCATGKGCAPRVRRPFLHVETVGGVADFPDHLRKQSDPFELFRIVNNCIFHVEPHSEKDISTP